MKRAQTGRSKSVSNPKNNPRPRQIPKQDRSRAAVAAIQEATLLVLLESGFEDWTTNAIADRAGVGIGSLYRYFTNKESIVASLTRNGAAELLANPLITTPSSTIAYFSCIVLEVV